MLLFAAVSRSLQTPDDYARLGREFVADALEQNVIYGEFFVSPSVWSFFQPELDLRATDSRRSCTSCAPHSRARRFKLLPDLTRNFGADSAMATAKLAASLADHDVIGIELGWR